MAKAELLRVQDVSDAYRLIGECRDLGSEPTLWFPRMLEGLCRLFGASDATGGEGRWLRPHRPIEQISGFAFGLKGRDYELFVAYMRTHEAATDPIYRAVQHVPDRLITLTRRQVVSDTLWYRSTVFNEYFRPTGIDHRLVSLGQSLDVGAISGIDLDRPKGDRDFSPREQCLLRFFHGELGRLIGRSLVSAMEPSPENLSPRLRQTLACLLEGDSEKQVAARLSLSHPTTHQYVTALYRHFGVQSRAQLMAHAIKRLARHEWKEICPR